MKKVWLKSSVVLLSMGLGACSWDWFGQSNPPPPNGPVVYQTETKIVKTTAVADDRQVMTADSSLNQRMPTNIVSRENIGGHVGKGMDSIDQSKLSHALDNPIGKSSQWSNTSTGVQYTVVPTQKITVEGNAYCRRYKTTAVKGSKVNETSGVACVGANGNWEPVNG